MTLNKKDIDNLKRKRMTCWINVKMILKRWHLIQITHLIAYDSATLGVILRELTDDFEFLLPMQKFRQRLTNKKR